MITTTYKQKKTLRKIDSQIAQIQSQMQAMNMQRNSYILSIIEGHGDEDAEYELNKHYNLEVVENIEDIEQVD